LALRHRYADKELVIDAAEDAATVRLTWSGKSTEREPGRFLVPIFTDVLALATPAGKRIAMDFTAVEYMNSSTFTPIVKLLDEARRAGVSVLLEFDGARKWQALSFSALRAFETPDGRIAVRSR